MSLRTRRCAGSGRLIGSIMKGDILKSRCAILLAGVLLLAHSLTMAADRKAKFVTGPAKGQLGTVADINVPEGYILLDSKSTQAILEKEGEPTSGNELGWLRPTNEQWSVIFEFDDVGYVKDADKEKLDADKLLSDIKRSTVEANKQRVKAGGDPVENLAWEIPPNYNPDTHDLEWAIRGTVLGKPILNYNIRILGRKGVMEAVLLIDPDQLKETLPTFRDLLKGYSYQSGQSYAEYRSGDKIAKYGLAALITGGAAVGAAKLGLFTWLAVLLKKGGKAIVVALVAVGAFFKRIFGRIFGGKKDSQME